MTYRLVPLDRPLLDQCVAIARDAPWLAGAAQGDDLAAKLLHPELAWAMIDGGRLLGCGGAVPTWPGRAVVWLIVTRLARPRDIVFGVKAARTLFAKLQLHAAFRRLELMACADRAWCHSFARALGFALEGRCAAFGPDGQDYLIFGRVAGAGLPIGREGRHAD